MVRVCVFPLCEFIEYYKCISFLIVLASYILSSLKQVKYRHNFVYNIRIQILF